MFVQFRHLLSRAGAGVLPVLLSTVGLTLGAAAQTSPLPPVIVSNPVAVTHTGTFGNPWQSAVSTHGDFVLYDFKTDGLYEFPATGGAEIVIAAPGVVGTGFQNSGVAIDPRNNNLYIDNNYNGGLREFPYDTTTNSWDLPSVVVANNLTGSIGGSNGTSFQGAGLSINASGVMAVATENSQGVEIFTVPIDLSGNFGPATPIVANMVARARTVAIDNAGNIYYSEDIGASLKTPSSAMYIPAGTNGLNGEASVMKIDYPQAAPAFSNIQGVSVDAAGNIYVVDASLGAYVVPLVAGVPSPKQAFIVSTIPANGGGPSIDSARGVLFYPIGTSGTITDLVEIYLNRNEFGSTPAGSGTAVTSKVNYFFNATTTPYTFSIQQDGLNGVFSLPPDLTGCGITLTPIVDSMGNPVLDKNGNQTYKETATPYAANSTCALTISFTPTAVGKATATLTMQDANGVILSSSVLHGSGSGAVVLGLPDTESALGGGLKAPSQIAVDYAGNIYVADSGLGKVYQYAKGATNTTAPVSLGTGLVTPTGVAVDGAGDVYIADSGKLLEIPYTPAGPPVTSPAVQIPAGLIAANQVTLKTGLGAGVTLAADGIGDVFAADPANQRYIRLRNLLSSIEETDTAGFTQLTAIAADGQGDVFLANGQTLIEVSAAGSQTLSNSLVNATSIAVDHSGAIYVTSPTQTVRIPNVGGTLNATNQAVLATTAAKPTSVAVDAAGNAYVTDAAAEDIVFSSTNAASNLGKLATTTSSSTGSVNLLDNGNLPLTITGFGATADYSVTANTCVGTAVAVGSACSATVTFNPGPGDQGSLIAALAIQGSEINLPSVINVTGTGVTLANSTANVTVSKPTVTNAPVVVTVTPATGTSPVPTGNVTVTVTGLATGSTPITSTQPLVNGSATFKELTLQAGNLTFTANYIGDRVYGRSTAAVTSAVAVGTLSLSQPPAASVPVYVLVEGSGSAEPYDGSQTAYEYSYPIQITAANGAPLVGIPILNNKGAVTGTNYGTVTYQLASGATGCVGTSSTINVQADGTAPFSTACFAIDTSNNQIPDTNTTYTVTPVYSGANYATFTGTPVTFIALRNPSVVITSSPGAITVAAGSTASANLTLTSLLGYGVTGVNGNLNNYSLPVDMNCANLPAHATCSFSYPTPDPSDANSTDVTPTTPGAAILTFNTNVAVGTSTTSSLTPTRTAVSFAGAFALSLLGLAFGRRKTLRAGLLTLVVLTLASFTALGLSACSSADISAHPNLTTPKGTYTITVTAKQAGSKQVPSSTAGGAPITVYGNGNQMSIPFTMNVTVQ